MRHHRTIRVIPARRCARSALCFSTRSASVISLRDAGITLRPLRGHVRGFMEKRLAPDAQNAVPLHEGLYNEHGHHQREDRGYCRVQALVEDEPLGFYELSGGNFPGRDLRGQNVRKRQEADAWIGIEDFLIAR